MRIDQIETFIAGTWLITRVTTDSGLQGIGESTFFGWPRATQDIVESFGDYLVGKDPLAVEQHWKYRDRIQRSKALRGGQAPISGGP